MNEYYYLTGKIQNGPFTLEELRDKMLTGETLVWAESMENWQKLKDLPDLFEKLNYKKVPPPPPSDNEVKVNETESLSNPNVATDRDTNSVLGKVKPSNKALRFFIVWTSIHLFALITSYSEIDLFNSRKPKTDEFWPFVKFIEPKYTSLPQGYTYEEYQKLFAEKRFNGLFYRYDWSEFAIYAGGALLIFLYLRLSDKEPK